MVDYRVSIKVITNIEKLMELFPSWRQLQIENNRLIPQSDPDFYLQVILNMSGIISPLVLILKDSNGKPLGLILGRYEKTMHQLSIGYKKIAKIPVNRITLMNGGDILKSDSGLLRAVASAILREAHRIGADMIFVNGIEDNQTLYNEFKKRNKLSRVLIAHKRQRHWSLRIPKTISEWDAAHSKKHLSNLRSRRRKIQKIYGETLKVRVFRHPNELDEMINDVEVVAKKTYQRGIGVGFVNDSFRRKIFSLAAEKGWLRSYVLYLGNRACVYQLGFQYGNGYFVQGKGYDPEFRKYGIGNILFRIILKDFCREGVIKVWDFGIGEADYKQYQGTNFIYQSFIHAYLPTPKGLELGLMHFILSKTQKVLKAYSEKIGILTSVKTKWRRKLTP